MSSSPYTQHRRAQFRGPTDSADYNQRIEENYLDLMVLYNKSKRSDTELKEFFRRLAKSEIGIQIALGELEDRIRQIELQQDASHITVPLTTEETTRFDGSIYAVEAASRLTLDSRYGIALPPRIDAASQSKLLYVDSEGNEILPPSLVLRVVGDDSTADSPTAYQEQSDPKYAVFSSPGFIWERNVVVDTPNDSGARLDLYLKVPREISVSQQSNAIFIHPFPSFNITIEDIAYTTAVNPQLSENDGYQKLNPNEYYKGEILAEGHIAPGSWTAPYEGDDQISKTGPRAFYFSPKDITAIRVTLHQDTAFTDADKYVYTYGLSQIDVRRDKFMDEGRSIFRVDSPAGKTISSIDSVEPQIWNINPALMDEHFSYRVLWETSYESGVYQEVPVANSRRAWVEVTLKNKQGHPPTLTGLTVEYS